MTIGVEEEFADSWAFIRFWFGERSSGVLMLKAEEWHIFRTGLSAVMTIEKREREEWQE